MFSLSNCYESGKIGIKSYVFRVNTPVVIWIIGGAKSLSGSLPNNIGVASRLLTLLIDRLLATNQDQFQALPFIQPQTATMPRSFLDGGKLVPIQRMDAPCFFHTATDSGGVSTMTSFELITLTHFFAH